MVKLYKELLSKRNDDDNFLEYAKNYILQVIDVYKEGGVVTNEYTGESMKLNAVELSIYDYIMGSFQLLRSGIAQEMEKNYGLPEGYTHNMFIWSKGVFCNLNNEAYYKLVD